MGKRISDFDDLYVYQKAYESAVEIFEVSKSWPEIEEHALTDQIRRSSRSVCANIAEAWGKRRYTAHLVNKLSTSEGEAAETMVGLDFAASCEYLDVERHTRLREGYHQIRGGLVKMMAKPETWCGPSVLREPSVDYQLGENAVTGF